MLKVWDFLLCRQSRVSGPLSRGHRKFFLQSFPGACQKSFLSLLYWRLRLCSPLLTFLHSLQASHLGLFSLNAIQLQPSREAEPRAWLSCCSQSCSCGHALAAATAWVIITLGSLTCYLHGLSLAGGLFHVHSLLTMTGSEGGEQVR